MLSGFALERLVPTDSSFEAWVATEEAEAPNVAEAVNGSRNRLMPVIDALAAVLQ